MGHRRTYRFVTRAHGVHQCLGLGPGMYLKVQGLRLLYGIDVLELSEVN